MVSPSASNVGRFSTPSSSLSMCDSSSGVLASYPGSLVMWGWKRDPGDYCVAHVPKFPDFWEFVISLYSSVADDVKLVS